MIASHYPVTGYLSAFSTATGAVGAHDRVPRYSRCFGADGTHRLRLRCPRNVRRSAGAATSLGTPVLRRIAQCAGLLVAALSFFYSARRDGVGILCHVTDTRWTRLCRQAPKQDTHAPIDMSRDGINYMVGTRGSGALPTSY